MAVLIIGPRGLAPRRDTASPDGDLLAACDSSLLTDARSTFNDAADEMHRTTWGRRVYSKDKPDALHTSLDPTDQEMDDFSFPTLIPDADSPPHLPYPHFAASPLWFLSSAAAEPAGEPPQSVSSGDPANEDGEKTASEKMDQLWEEFNEELAWLSLTQMEAEKQSAPLFWLLHSKPGKDSSKRKEEIRALGTFRHQSAAVAAALKLMKKVISIRSSKKVSAGNCSNAWG